MSDPILTTVISLLHAFVVTSFLPHRITDLRNVKNRAFDDDPSKTLIRWFGAIFSLVKLYGYNGIVLLSLALMLKSMSNGIIQRSGA